jgi:DNA modification methylase
VLLNDGQSYHVHHGDTIPHMASMPAASVDLTVTSVPFPQLYSYTNENADIGNSEDLVGSAKLHLSFFYRQLSRIIKPGRVAVVHVMQIPRMKRTGGEGLFDFRGFNIRLAERAGLIFEYDWLVRRNPQSQALRTRSRELQFAGLESDRAKSRGALPDYLLKFRSPGENAVPIRGEGQVSRNEWIAWAEAAWTGISETRTLNTAEGKGEDDTRHICAMQLDMIERLVRLYSNPGEIIFDPFTGIGSTGHEAIKFGRRFYGTELKPEYHATAIKNLDRAVRQRDEAANNLFSMFGDDVIVAPSDPSGLSSAVAEFLALDEI